MRQERWNALIEEARQRQAANGIDAELADQRRQYQKRRASDKTEAATVAAAATIVENPISAAPPLG